MDCKIMANFKIFSKISVMLLISILVGCKDKPYTPNTLEKSVVGHHQLRQMMPKDIQSSYLSGSYFLFLGSVSGSSSTVPSIQFSWKDNYGFYNFTTLPLIQVKVEIIETVVHPFIEIFINDDYCNDKDIDIEHGYINSRAMPGADITPCISYIIVYTNSKDWPEHIQLPGVK